MNKKHNEDVLEFIKRVSKIYDSFPAEIKPPQAATKVVFVGSFEPEFGFTLRGKMSYTLDQSPPDGLKVEANSTSTRN